MALWVKRYPRAGCCGDNRLPKDEGPSLGEIGKGADAKTVNRGLDFTERG